MLDLNKIGHGHVTKLKDATNARCGGPSLCTHCQLEEEVVRLRAKEKRLYVKLDDVAKYIRKAGFEVK